MVDAAQAPGPKLRCGRERELSGKPGNLNLSPGQTLFVFGENGISSRK